MSAYRLHLGSLFDLHVHLVLLVSLSAYILKNIIQYDLSQVASTSTDGFPFIRSSWQPVSVPAC